MKRYSLMWWSVVLPTSVVVGGSTFLLGGFLTDWGILERVVAAVVLTVVADLAIAAWIQSVAPTKVHIGPGEKLHDSELLSEKAKVIGGFDSSPHGRVLVRGETWRATRAPDDAASMSIGMDVNIVARDGLTLVVSANSR
jgi:membrane protein implicated in regulation of membrane protease activity